MCDERDRLIEFVYDECDAGERKLVETHLESCPECRREIAGLKRVRQDLLAWDVPSHEPVWRPLAQTAPPAWWQQVPAWAMAAAAGVMLIAGAAGGAVTTFAARAAADPAAEPMPQASATPEQALPAAVPVGLTAEDLSAAERRWLARMRAEFGAVDQRIRLVSAQAVSHGGVDPAVTTLVQQVNELRTMSEDQLKLFLEFHNERESIRQRDNQRFLELERRIADLASMIQVAR